MQSDWGSYCVSIVLTHEWGEDQGTEEGSKLWAEAEAREDVRKLAVGAKPREDRIDFQVHQPDVALLDCGLEPFECLLLIAEPGVYRSNCVR